eukprot:scaffold29976_cov17-Tisochrysis_lutea.AAC.1
MHAAFPSTHAPRQHIPALPLPYLPLKHASCRHMPALPLEYACSLAFNACITPAQPCLSTIPVMVHGLNGVINLHLRLCCCLLHVHVTGPAGFLFFMACHGTCPCVVHQHHRPKHCAHTYIYSPQVYHPCILPSKKRYVGFMYESPQQKAPTLDAKVRVLCLCVCVPVCALMCVCAGAHARMCVRVPPHQKLNQLQSPRFKAQAAVLKLPGEGQAVQLFVTAMLAGARCSFLNALAVLGAAFPSAHGIEIARRDNCPAVIKLMEASLRILFTTRDLSHVLKVVVRVVAGFGVEGEVRHVCCGEAALKCKRAVPWGCRGQRIRILSA